MGLTYQMHLYNWKIKGNARRERIPQEDKHSKTHAKYVTLFFETYSYS